MLSEIPKERDQLVESLTEIGILHALAGNLRMAEDTMNRLPPTEDSESQLLFIRGVASFHSGDEASAIRYLEDSLAIRPNNVAALSMLTLLEEWRGRLGQSDGYWKLAQQHYDSSNSQLSDAFFYTYALGYYDVEESVAGTEELLSSHKASPIMNATLAAQIGEAAILATWQPDSARSYLKEMERARDAVARAQQSTGGENQWVNAIDVWTRFVTKYLANVAEVDLANNFDQGTDEVIERLMTPPYFSEGLKLAICYQEISGRGNEKRDRLVEILAEHCNEKYWRESCQIVSGERTVDDLPAFEIETPASDDEIYMALLRMSSNSFRREIEANWQSLFDGVKDSRLSIPVLWLQLMLGNPDEVTEKARELLDGGFDARSHGHGKYIMPLLRNLSGDLPDADLLAKRDFARAHVWYHLQVGLKALAESGDKGEFRKHLELATTKQAPWMKDHFLVRAFLEQMESDESWPHWLE